MDEENLVQKYFYVCNAKSSRLVIVVRCCCKLQAWLGGVRQGVGLRIKSSWVRLRVRSLSSG